MVTRGKEIRKRGARGPMPACWKAKERKRRMRIAAYYVLKRLPTHLVAVSFGISTRTVIRYVHEVLTYPEPEAQILRTALLKEQGHIPTTEEDEDAETLMELFQPKRPRMKVPDDEAAQLATV